MRTTRWLLGLGLVTLLAACTIKESQDDDADASPAAGGSGGAPDVEAGTGGSDDASVGEDAGPDGAGGQEPEEAVVPSRSGELEEAASCPDLEAKLKADALSRMNDNVDRNIEYIKRYYDTDAGAGGTGGSGESAAWEDIPEAGRDYTETNAQTQGVDEADIVKTDGTNVYLLHGQNLVIVQAWPPESTQFSKAVSIEGKPVEMFVADGRAVVYSHVDGAPIYSAAGVQPKPTHFPEDYGWDGYSEGIDPEYLLTKVTVLDLNAATPSVTAENYYEGMHLSARRVGDAVRSVIVGGSHGPMIDPYPTDYGDTEQEMIDAWEALREQNKQRIEASTVGDWLPYRFSRTGGQVTATSAPCEEYLVPGEGSSEYGLVHLQSFDWTNPTAVYGVSIASRASTVYADTDSIYLAAPVSDDSYYDSIYSAEPQPAGTVVPVDSTHIHKFDVTSGASKPVYVASGTVRGRVLSQFAMDERNGTLRVVTEGMQYGWADDGAGGTYPLQQVTNHLFTLKTEGNKLTVLGRLLHIARDEFLRAARFLEDRGYIVTFEELDPLFVVDLADPAAPKILGSVEIPGFSEYIHPVDANHLLTIGKETVDEGMGPIVTGVSMQLFDVSNPTAPAVKFKHVFEGDSYTFSEAENDHRAFVYEPSEGVVVFPFVAIDGYGSVHTTLQVFRVDLQTGFTLLGAPTHDQLINGTMVAWCLEGDVLGASIRRGLFIDDYLYSISYGGVLVHALGDLEEPVAQVPLSSPAALGFSCAPPN